MGTISDVLYCARDWVWYSRWTDPEEGTVFGRWFAEKTGEPYFGTSGVPYCAMFASYCLDWAGVPCAGMPSAYCPDIVNAAREAGCTPYNEDAEPGDLVLFDWGGDGLADHVGIVEENHPSEGYMTTIEGNTSSGSGGVSAATAPSAASCGLATTEFPPRPSREALATTADRKQAIAVQARGLTWTACGGPPQRARCSRRWERPWTAS